MKNTSAFRTILSWTTRAKGTPRSYGKRKSRDESGKWKGVV